MLLKGLNDNIYKLIKPVYKSSFSQVKCRNVSSDPVLIILGVHQRSVLSPLLFNTFINDIGEILSLEYAPILHDTKIGHLINAGDLVLLSTSEKSMLVWSTNLLWSTSELRVRLAP